MAGRARHGKSKTQSESSDTRVLLPRLALPCVHLMNGPALVLVQRPEETRQHRGKASQLWTLPHAATLCGPGSNSSGSLGGGRTPASTFSTISKVGVRNPQILSVLCHFRQLPSGMVSPGPLQAQGPILLGVRQITERQSAQLAQKAALLIVMADSSGFLPRQKAAKLCHGHLRRTEEG